MLPTPDSENAPPRPPKPTRETEEGTKYNESSSINSQEIEEDYEIDLKRLEVQDEVLGEGEFGVLYKGRYHGKDTKVIDVAVKKLKAMYVDSEFIPCVGYTASQEYSKKLSGFHVYIYHTFNLYLQASTDHMFQRMQTLPDLTVWHSYQIS